MAARIIESSELPVDAVTFLADFTLDAVNAELGPLLSMTAPAAYRRWPILDWPTGRPLFSSWVLFCRLLPLDRHYFYLETAEPGAGFVECSSSWINRTWEHERRVVPTGGGCTVEDRVGFQCRLALLGYLLEPVYRAVFRHRHRRLRARFADV